YKANQTIGSLPYNEYVGRIARVTKVIPSSTGVSGSWNLELMLEDTGEKIKALAVSNTVKGIALIADIENARARYMGKTLWLQNSAIQTFKAGSDEVEFVSLDTSKPIKVIDVVASWSDEAPVRFIVQTGEGKKGFRDVSMSGTNVSDTLRKYNKFEDEFLTVEPQENRTDSFTRIPKPSPQLPPTSKQNDVLGWQDARWGMTEADIVRTFGSSLKKLPKRDLYKNAYVDYVIPDLKLNRENFTVHLQMDAKTNRLVQILIRLDQMESDSPRNDAFLGLEELLSQKYGTPSYKKDEMEYLILRTRQWTFSTTIIELSYSYVKSISSSTLTIRYFPASASDANKL
ncbi:MAG TPA: hypothetical protein VFQ47_06770, partial [Nitrososphaera sp.]|nr:hypothetical protein [Nitrososphaera sp.]